MSKKLGHWTVYGLFDPTTGAIRYVGQTSYRLGHRLSRHIYEAKHQKVCDLKREWILALAADGMRPEIRSIEVAASAEEAHDAESRQIRVWAASGANLFNETMGGAGSRGRFLRPSTKAKIGEANSGRESPLRGTKHRSDSIEKMRDAKMGKPNAMKGKKYPPEFGEKLRAIKASKPNPLKGRTRSPETKAKISAAKMGRPRNKIQTVAM